MSILQISKSMDSAEFARVKEITKEGDARRTFEVMNDDEKTPAFVSYATEYDMLYCARHNTTDDCTHTARVRLCGILTQTVTLHAGIMMLRKKA